MSGPKISVYEFSERSRRIVLDQMRCEQRSVLCAQQIQELICQILSYGGELQKQTSLMELLERRDQSAAGKREELLNLKKRMEAETGRLRSKLAENMPQISDGYGMTEETLEAKKQELEKLRALKRQVQGLREEIDAAVGIAAGRETVVSEMIRHSIADNVGGYISFDVCPEDDAPDTGFEECKTGLKNELSALLGDAELPPDIIREIQNAIAALDKIHQMEYLSSFDSVTVKNIFRKVDDFRRRLEEKQAEFDEVCGRYKMLCSMMKEPARAYRYSEEALAEIEEETERLEAEAVQAQEQSYVSECVDQVMAEMGYDLIGSREVVKKKSGKRFRNELFTFDEGTAVNVTYSSDGQISMELGGIAREDRIPDSAETERLTQDMRTFCGEFAEFERRLKEKGVVVRRRIALAPPDAAYASIINIADYDIAGDVRIVETAAVSRGKKAAEKKTMRRTE